MIDDVASWVVRLATLRRWRPSRTLLDVWTSRIISAALGALVLLSSAGCSAVIGAGPNAATAQGSRLHIAQIGSVHAGEGDRVQIVRTTSAPTNENEWEVVRLDPRSNQVHIQWADGFSPRCGQSDQVLVHETTRAITIGLHSTYSGPDANCAAFAVSRTRTIPLKDPIGTRALLEYIPDGVNADYSFVRDPERLPVPRRCLHGSAERNAPIGALDAAERIVPFTPTRALICPENPHAAERVLTAPSQLAALTREINSGSQLPLNPYGFPSNCAKDRTVFYDIYLSNASSVVEVTSGDGGCRAISNGIRTTDIPTGLPHQLQTLTTS